MPISFLCTREPFSKACYLRADSTAVRCGTISAGRILYAYIAQSDSVEAGPLPPALMGNYTMAVLRPWYNIRRADIIRIYVQSDPVEAGPLPPALMGNCTMAVLRPWYNIRRTRCKTGLAGLTAKNIPVVLEKNEIFPVRQCTCVFSALGPLQIPNAHAAR